MSTGSAVSRARRGLAASAAVLAIVTAGCGSDDRRDAGTQFDATYLIYDGTRVPIPEGPAGEPTERWNATFGDIRDVVGLGDEVVVGAADRIAGLDPASGATRWESSLDGWGATDLMPAADVVIATLEKGARARRVSAFAAEDGKEQWARETSGWVSEVVGDVVIVRKARGFEVWSLADGRPVWGDSTWGFRDGDRIVTLAASALRVRMLATGEEVTNVTVDNQANLRSVGGGVALLDDGRRAWVADIATGDEQFAVPDGAVEPTAATIEGDLLLVLGEEGTRAYELGPGGVELWERGVFPQGWLVRVGGGLVFSGWNKRDTVVIDAVSGEERLRVPRGESRALSDRYLMVANGDSVVAYDLRSGAEAWSIAGDAAHLGVAGSALVVLDGKHGKVTCYR